MTDLTKPEFVERLEKIINRELRCLCLKNDPLQYKETLRWVLEIIKELK